MICDKKCEISPVKILCRYCRIKKCFDVGLQNEKLKKFEDVVVTNEQSYGPCICPVCDMDIAAAKRRPMLTDSGPGVCRNCYRVFEKRATSDGLKVEPCKIDNKCVITRETRIQCLNCFMAKCFSLGLSLGKFNSMESLPNSIDSKKQETTAPESRPKRQVTVPEVVSKRPSRKSVEKRTTSPDKLKVTKVVEKVKPKVAPNQSTKPKAKRGRPPKNPIKVVKSPSSAPKSPKPPKKEKCPICKTVLLPGSSSIEFGFAACRQCARFFKRKYESNEWTIPKCIDGLKKCKITFEDRTKCKFCLMKTCFKVGFKYDDFDKMKKLQVESNDLNQNLKVKLIDAEVKALVPFEPRKRKAEVLEQPVAKFTKTECEVCGAESKGVRNGVHACNPCGGFFWKVSKARKAVRCKANQNCNVGLSKCPYCRLKRCLIAGMNVIGSREALEYTDEEIEQILDGNYDIEKDDSEEMLALEETEYNKISKTPAKQSSVRKPQPTVLALEYKKGNCTICSRDNAHYFQAFFVCQKCVNFFQNSITNKNMYFCQKASCSTLKTAKCCKYCRLKKCLELGMNNNGRF